MQYLHFSNNMQQPIGERMFKVDCVRSKLVKKFKSTFRPLQNLCIDKSLLLFKGRLLFKQYNPKKRSQLGIKTFVTCDCTSCFVLDVLPYVGKQEKLEGKSCFGVTGDIVLKLMQDYMWKNHIVFMDNWFTSPLLFQKLAQMQTGAVGTVRRD